MVVACALSLVVEGGYSLVVACRLHSASSVVAGHELSWLASYGIFQDQGLN